MTIRENIPSPDSVVTSVEESETDINGDIQEITSDTSSMVAERQRIKEIPGTPFHIENLTPAEITPEFTRSLSRLFRYTFNNDFDEFLVDQETAEQKGAREIFGYPPKKLVPLELMDGMKEMPLSARGVPMEFFHDPEATIKKLSDKFSKGYVMLVRNSESNEVAGFTFGYEDTLRGVFDSEWKYRYTYTRAPSEKARRDEKSFIEAVAPELSVELTRQLGSPVSVDWDSKVFCWNCGAAMEGLRGSGILPLLIQSFFESLPPEKVATLGVVGETIKDTKPHRILSHGGFRTLEGVLGGDYVLLTATLKKLASRFSMEPEAFKQRR